jgi:hypothetical protein
MQATIRLRHSQWTKLVQLAGITSDQTLARRMGISRSSVSRVLRNGGEVGARFIAGALVAFPELDFDDLFVVTVDTQTPQAPPPEPPPKPPKPRKRTPKPLAGGSRDSAPRPQGPRPR